MIVTRRCCFLLIAVVLPCVLSAQPLQVWLHQYGSESQTSYHMIRTSAGNYAHCVRAPYSGDALYLSDSNGEELWHQTYGETGNYDSNEDVIEMPDGGFLLAGYAWVDAQGAYDARLIRTNSGGGVIWETLVGDGEQTDYGHGVVRTSNGRIFMTGQTWTGTRSEGAVWEFNDDGDLINTHVISEGEYSVGFHTIILTNDNHLVMSGGGYFNLNDYDGYAVKCDLDGNVVWENVLYINEWQYMSRINQSPDGYYIFAGNGVSTPNGYSHPWYGRLDADGNLEWTEYYGNPTSSSYLLSCTPDLDGNWLLSGRYEGVAPNQNALLLKIDPADGSLIWTLLEGDSEPGSDEGFSDLVVLDDGSYILGGDGDFGAISHPGFIAMYNETGSAVGSVDRVIMPSRFEIADVYPNPFNATVHVLLQLSQPGLVTMDVVNMQGQVVGVIQRGQMSAGQHEFSWAADGVGSGVYFIRAQNSLHEQRTERICLLK